MQCCTYTLVSESQELQLRETQVINYQVCSFHTGLLQEAYKENHISEQFLPGRREEAIYLPTVLLPSVAHFCVSLYRKNSSLCLQSASPSPSLVLPRCGISFKFGSWGMAGTPTTRKREGHSQGNLRSIWSLCPTLC